MFLTVALAKSLVNLFSELWTQTVLLESYQQSFSEIQNLFFHNFDRLAFIDDFFNAWVFFAKRTVLLFLFDKPVKSNLFVTEFLTITALHRSWLSHNLVWFRAFRECTLFCKLSILQAFQKLLIFFIDFNFFQGANFGGWYEELSGRI